MDSENELEETSSLEKELSAPISTNTVSKQMFLDIITHAEVLRDFDQRDRVLPSVIREPLTGEYSLSTVYETAEALDIAPEYVERAIGLRCPSVEQRLSDLKESGAKPSYRVIRATYQDIMLQALRDTFPTDEFGVYLTQYVAHDQLRFFRISKRKRRFLSFEWTSERRQDLAHINVSFCYDIEIDLKNQTFPRACGKLIAELRESFRPLTRKYDIQHSYKFFD